MKMLQRPPFIQVLLAILLLSIATGASAREASKLGPNGEGGACPGAIETDEQDLPATKRAQAAPRAKAKAAPALRSGADTTTRPRWHSFLPGMFR